MFLPDAVAHRFSFNCCVVNRAPFRDDWTGSALISMSLSKPSTPRLFHTTIFALLHSIRPFRFRICSVSLPNRHRVVRYPPGEIFPFFDSVTVSSFNFHFYDSKNPAVFCIIPCASFRHWDKYYKVISRCRADRCRRCHLYPFLLHFYHYPLFDVSVKFDILCRRYFPPVLLVHRRVIFFCWTIGSRVAKWSRVYFSSFTTLSGMMRSFFCDRFPTQANSNSIWCHIWYVCRSYFG